MLINFIIVNYNVSNKLKNCLSGFQKCFTSFKIRVNVIDNNSSDQGKEEIVNVFPDVNYHQLNSNLGFAKANNIGARLNGSEFLCFLNPDTLVIEDFITPIINFIDQNPKAGACAPMLVYEDMSYQSSSGFKMGFWFEFLEAFSLISFLRMLDKRKYLKIQKNAQPVKTGWVSGACLIVRRSVFEKAGCFTEDYFLNYEDIDLCKKIEDAGYVNYYFPSYKCIHLDHKSFDKNFELLVFSRYQSRLVYAKIHYGFFLRYAVRFMHIWGLLIRLLTVNIFYSGLERKSRFSGYFKSLKLYLFLSN